MNKLLLSFSLFMLLVVGMVLPPQEAKASHYVGSDLTFAYISPGKYLLRLKVYRDCGGITFGNTAQVTATMPGCTTFVQNLTQQYLDEASEVCPGQLTECTSPPDNTIPGIQIYEYSGFVNLGTACVGNWNFSFSGNARNGGILNLLNANTVPTSSNSEVDWYTDAYLNTSIPNLNNNSPIFSSSPVPYVCLNDTVQYNPQVTDPDNDSLVYTLVSARTGANNIITYTNNGGGVYTAQKPFGINNYTVLDPQTGQFNFKPTISGTYVVVIKVEEFRTINGAPTLIGFVHRDVQVQVIVCNSTPPVLSNLQIQSPGLPTITFPPNVVQEVEACVEYCIKIPATTAQPGAVLTMTTNAANEIPNSVFTLTGQGTPNVSGLLCFQANPELAGQTFSFTVKVTDDVCPFPNKFVRAFTIKVNKATGFDVTASEDTICVLTPVQLTTVARPNTVALTDTAYTSLAWTATTLAGQPVQGFFNDPNSLNPIVSPRSSTRYTLTGNTIYGCEDVSSVIVIVKGVQPTIQSIVLNTPTDSVLCVDQTTTLTTTVSGPIGILNTPWTYNWTPTGLNNPNIASPTVSYVGTDTLNYQLIVNNGLCSDTASVRIRFVPAAIPTALSDVTNPICVGDTINLMSSVAGLGTNGSTYLWTGDRVNSPTDSITFARPFTVGTAGYVVSITTPLGCTVRDTVLIYVKGVLPNLQPLLDSTTLCQNGSTQITAITAFDPAAGDPDAIYNWSPGIGLSDSTIANPFFSYVPGQPLQQTYTLLVSSGGCPDSSQTTITYVPDVTVTLAVDDDKICVGDTIWLNPVITPSGVPGAAISWEGEGINDPTAISTFALPMTKGIKEYKFRLVLGTDCIDSVSVQVNVEGVTPVITNIGAGNSPLCFGDSTTISADVNPEFTTTPSNILHTWSASNSNGGIVNPLADSTVIKPTETTTYTLTASDGGYCIVDSSITVEVGAPLDFSFDLTFSPDSLSPVPVSVTFTANITTTGPVDSVYWILTDLNNPDAPTIYLDGRSGSATYEFTTNAQYDVVMYVHTPNCPVRSTTRPLWIGAFVVPNVITPNGDGVNDVFMIPNLKPNSTVHIFNRWGKELKTFGPTENWAPDAELPGGIYFYSVDERNTGRIYKGWLELMR